MPVTFSTATHTGLVRRSNEDALFASPPLFMVADGMGGARAGEVAAGEVAKAFKQFTPREAQPEQGLADLIVRVNRDIYQMAADAAEHRGMGTTVTAAVLTGNSVGIAHVGDSRAYLWRGGELTQLTDDHSLVGEMLKLGKISPADVKDHPQRSVITRALGVEQTVDVDTHSIALKGGDLFLLCSDGLHSMVSDHSIAAILARGADLDTTAGLLVEAANAGGGLDNVTVVLFSPDGSLPAGAASGQGREAGPAADTGTLPAVKDAAGAPAGSRERKKRSWPGWAGTIPGRITIVLLAAAVIIGGTLYATRQMYYLDVENGHVAIYQGVPYSLGPLPLHSLYLESQVGLDTLEPFEQERVARRELHTLNEAQKILDNYRRRD